MRRMRAHFVIAISAVGLPLMVSVRCEAADKITQADMVRRAQELMDAAASGDRTPYIKYFADDCLYFDEKGRKMNKTQLVADVSPLPAGYTGIIKVINPQSLMVGDTAILSYDEDETETIFGQVMTARYHETDTWMLRNGQWQIVAGQVLRYYEDPAPGSVDVAAFRDYAGTYELSPGNRLTISTDGKELFRQRGTQPKGALVPEATDIFFRPGVEGRILFRRGGQGGVVELIDRRNNEDVVWKKIE
jgi:Domain of unknown function (DUF4440)